MVERLLAAGKRVRALVRDVGKAKELLVRTEEGGKRVKDLMRDLGRQGHGGEDHQVCHLCLLNGSVLHRPLSLPLCSRACLVPQGGPWSWLLPLRPGKRKKREDEVEGVAVDVADDAQFDIAPTA